MDNFEVYPLLLYYLLAYLDQRGPVIKTVATSSLVDRVAERFGVPVQTTGVGFKHIAPAMVASRAIIGGEESGGYAFGDHLPERDGILAGLRVLDLLVKAGKPLSRLLADLRAEFGPSFYRRADLPFAADLHDRARRAIREVRPDQVAGVVVTGVRTDDGLRLDLADGSWLLLRLSGTEPIARVAAEALSEERVLAPDRRGRPPDGAGALIDSHAHLDDARFDADREQVLTRARAGGVELVINIGADLESSRQSVALAEGHPFVYAAVGIHPHDALSLDDAALATLRGCGAASASGGHRRDRPGLLSGPVAACGAASGFRASA